MSKTEYFVFEYMDRFTGIASCATFKTLRGAKNAIKKFRKEFPEYSGTFTIYKDKVGVPLGRSGEFITEGL